MIIAAEGGLYSNSTKFFILTTKLYQCIMSCKKGVQVVNILNKPYKETGNYLCTWGAQASVAKHFNVKGRNIPEQQRNVMNDDMLFRSDSLYHLVPKKYRSAIFFLLDDGWDVPYDTDASNGALAPFGSVIPDSEKFPNYGNNPTEKLKTLSDKVKALGYAGLGLWISPQMVYEKEDATLEEARKYWSERARWCNDAGVRYWKVDWGKHCFTRDYLEMMTECVKENAPNLFIEHAFGQGPFFGATSPEDPKAKRMAEIFEVSDYFRTYDVLEPFVDSESLCRLDALLSNADKTKMKSGVGGYINIESSPFIAAGLCVNMGIMRGGGNVDAAISWQRMAPPMSVFEADYIKSERRLTDYKYGDVRPANWTDFYEKTFEISAPAITARGTKLPLVSEMEEPPFVMASCHSTTKAYTIATLHRVIDPNNHFISLADITVFPEALDAVIGIFGYYKNLTVEFDEKIPENAKIYAQCMLDDEAFEVTDKVNIENNRLVLEGKLLRLWGRSKKALGYKEDPAVAIKIVIED